MTNKRKIEIRGIIAGAEFDDFLTADYQTRGVLTTENRVRAALKEAADAGDGAEIWISSPGGSVIAGGEMLAAIRDFPGPKKIIVGSMAGSMAANIVLNAGCRVECFENSLFMFHSASATVDGGPGTLSDHEGLLDKLNAPMIARLLALGLDEGRVREGFQDGRQLFLDAKEALACGLVSKIRGGTADALPAATDEEMQSFIARDQTLAALIVKGTEPMEADQTDAAPADETQESPQTPQEAPATVEGETPPADPAPAPQTPQEAPETPPATNATNALALALEAAAKSEANARAIQSAASKRIFALEKEVEALKAQTLADREDLQALAKAHETTLKELAATKALHASLVGNVLSDPQEIAPKDWPEAVRKHGQATALRLYPQLAADYRSARNVKASR